ncbi:MAG TPA: nucleotidyltransferase domain-containing protein [Acidobacteriota bacterium]|nr:nucleotidyltransferase domain-containing protein [Acidobacteriota bacterium]
MTKLNAIEEKALSKILPKVSILPKVEKTLQALRKSATELKYVVDIRCGGSVAKNTYLAGDYDCDVFVRFDKKHIGISKLLLKLLEKAGIKPVLVNGSRDYFQAKIDGIQYEIVPVLWINDPKQAENVTDMSVFHVDWVLERTKGNDLSNQIRLGKAFCKANRVYGAESYIGGFSGHVLDILTIYYGGFREMLSAATNWPEKCVIDPMQFYAGKDALSLLNEAKIVSPLIIVDPILPSRNAASALTLEKWRLFKQAAVAYLGKPSASYFEIKEISAASLASLGTVITVKATPLSEKKDVAGAKLLQAYDFIRNALTENGFTVNGSDWTWKFGADAQFFYALPSKKIDPSYEILGPPIKMTKACDAFMAARSRVVEKTVGAEKRLVAIETRAFVDADAFISSLKKNPYLIERVKFA